MTDVDRRSVLRMIAGAPLAVGFGISGSEALLAQERVAKAAAGGPAYEPAFFNAHEWETVRILVDLILPADERSGSATDARVPEFIDYLMTDPLADDRSLEERQTAMRGGLAWIDARCRSSYGRDFVDCTEAQRLDLLDEIAYSTGEEEYEDEERSSRDTIPAPARHGPAFFNSFRDLTASGFWSSRMGVADLDYRGNVATEWTGPPPEVLRKLGL